VLIFTRETPHAMKGKYLIIFICLLLSFSCTDDATVTFETTSYTGEDCKTCPNVTITLPNAIGENKLEENINIAIREELIYLLRFDDAIETADIPAAIKSFTKGYKNMEALFAEERTPWEATVTGVISYESKEVLTVKLESYLFTGGAHGYSTTHFLNFDKQKGFALENDELFNNESAFLNYAENVFRRQEQIPLKDPINSTGFMFETDTYQLPENMGYTKDGFQLFYEQYEIASYADGPIVLTLPYTKVNAFLFLPSK